MGWEEIPFAEDPGNGFVYIKDAEAEIEKARKEAEGQGRADGWATACQENGKYIDRARAEERESIRFKLNATVDAVNDLLRRMNDISPGNRP